MNTLHEEGKDHDEEDDPNSANSETPISQGPISQAVEIRGCDTNMLARSPRPAGRCAPKAGTSSARAAARG